MAEHEFFMQRCLDLAICGIGVVSPNPMVGCVIVVEGRIIGEGYHQNYGGPHAEANAIESVITNYSNADPLLLQATLYVNLEPCVHFGKRPPCSDLIILHKIQKVVVGCSDPFKLVDGKGIEKLRSAGILVIEDILKDDCIRFNKRFFLTVQKQRPYIILKWAQTADHFFAPADKTQRWISSKESKMLVHKWRSEEDAVLVGKNTAFIDDPQLNVRNWKGRNPTRIVIDRNLQLPKSLKLFDQTQSTIIFNSIKTQTDSNLKYLQLEDFDTLLPQLICYQLYLMDVQSLIIEGGKKTLDLFINAGLWDESRVFISNQNWRYGLTAPEIVGELITLENIGTDALEIRTNNNNR